MNVNPVLYSTLDITLIVGFLLYALLMYLALQFKNKILFVLCGLFFFIPISLYENWVIILFSVCGFLFHIIIGLYNHDDSEEI